MEYNLHNEVIRWQISKSTKVVPSFLVPAQTVSHILIFQIFYLQKVGQGQGEIADLSNKLTGFRRTSAI